MLTSAQCQLLAESIGKCLRGESISIFDFSKIKTAFDNARQNATLRERMIDIAELLDSKVGAEIRQHFHARKP